MSIYRRLSQIFFLLLFLWVVANTRYPGSALPPSDIFLLASPLLSLSTSMAARELTWIIIPGLAILLLTIVWGRFFCGWICPLGSTLDATDKLFRRSHGDLSEHLAGRLTSIKYSLLVFILVASLFSLQIAGFIDPIALFFRTTAVILYPLFAHLNFLFFKMLFSWDALVEPLSGVFEWSRQHILPFSQPQFIHTGLISLMALIILLFGMISRRFWCRYLCPLGALFALAARFRRFRRVVDEHCTACPRCTDSCRMRAVAHDAGQTDLAECVVCGECLTVCSAHAIDFQFKKRSLAQPFDHSKRSLLWGLPLAAATAGLVKLNPAAQLCNILRPPGVLHEDEFLDRCIRCQNCVHICGSTGGILQPAFMEFGFPSIWTPKAAARLGYCEYECNLCGQSCPTGAIPALSLAEKQFFKMGIAIFDKNVCIPWSSDEDCLVCEEHCPVPEKAIRFDTVEKPATDGRRIKVKLPFVVQDRCIGCGICEFKCPVYGSPGIVIHSVGTAGTIRHEVI